ncbi:EAL domain-containing protein [Pigmentiphaga aceris]|uniref:EAL domain-containing protein n=1 Tax=Pigmentiphaga aceris TaxID=1940612 RepID=A0A5C0AV86_9BURK|nr:EAL domain-containing protein [Pigmentiphaga aceris]QEI04581.1 EAL domain-containing protein [Pigmentiphaga aceris]
MNTSTEPRADAASDILAQTLEQAADAVVVIDEHNCVTLFNAAAETLWGRPRATVLGQHVSLLIPHMHQFGHDDHIENNRKTGINRAIGISRDVSIERANGECRWVSVSLSRIDSGGRIFYTAFLKDVTHQREQEVLLRQVLVAVNESDSATIVTGPDTRVRYINAGVTRLLGYTLPDLEGKIASQVITGPNTDPKAIAKIREMIALPPADVRKRQQIDVLVYSKAGKPVWVSVQISPVYDDEGRLINYLGTLVDITQTKIYELLQHKALTAVAHEIPLIDVMSLICREVERLAPDVVAAIFAVDSMKRIHPLAAPSLPAEAAHKIDGMMVGPDAGSFGAAMNEGHAVWIEDMATDPRSRRCAEISTPLGLLSSWAVPLKKSDGDVVGAIVFYYRTRTAPTPFHQRLVETCVDLCGMLLEREESRNFIRDLASRDTLTGLANGTALASLSAKALTESLRRGTSLAILFINVDRFKRINDFHGYPTGDALLRALARRLAPMTGQGGSLVRLTGADFVMLLPVDATQAAGMAEQIQQACRRPFELGALVATIDVRIGIAMYPNDGMSIGVLLRNADMAMRQVEPDTRNGFCFYSAELNRHAHERLLLEAGLREVLKTDGLALHYQPQIDVATRRVTGVEALLRWWHPVLGNIAPPRFVLLAEQCGLIDQLGDWVLQHACRQLADWRQRGIAIPKIAVNVSPISFRNPELPTTVASLLTTHGLQPDELVLEMTEGVMLDADAATLACIDTLHNRGMRLSIDDFGTGYSSLSYLHRLPICELKLDKSFVHDLEHSDAARALTTSVLRIGESLGMDVVAEGVETEAQFRFLAEHGCQIAQGYLFAKPMPAADLERWLANHVTQCADTTVPALPGPDVTTAA